MTSFFPHFFLRLDTLSHQNFYYVFHCQINLVVSWQKVNVRLQVAETWTVFVSFQIYLSKIEKRIRSYNIQELNPPREGKRLLVLDIDYTLFDHRSQAETGIFDKRQIFIWICIYEKILSISAQPANWCVRIFMNSWRRHTKIMTLSFGRRLECVG